jgi:hypothetical protein
MPESGEEVVYMQEIEGEHRTQLWNETYSVKKTTKAEDERCSQLHNEMYSTRKIMKER